MKNNTSVKKVTLADSITSIGADAFNGAKNLRTIKLSANITEIAPGAFDGIKLNATFYITSPQRPMKNSTHSWSSSRSRELARKLSSREQSNSLTK